MVRNRIVVGLKNFKHLFSFVNKHSGLYNIYFLNQKNYPKKNEIKNAENLIYFPLFSKQTHKKNYALRADISNICVKKVIS